MSDDLLLIYYINGSFMVFEPSHALQLRQNRIVGHPIGVSDGGPHCISNYAASVVLSRKLATFNKLVSFETLSLEENRLRSAKRFEELLGREKELFTINRLSELNKRNIPVTPKTMKQFDDQKVRIDISNVPDKEIPALNSLVMTDEEVSSILTDTCEPDRIAVFGHLHSRGFFVGSGIKFGCDFLLYQGDPVRYHAQYAVRVVASKDGSVDLTKESFNEINAFQRLTHGANKIPVFATIHDDNIKYSTLEEREYVNSQSDSDIFKPIEPHLTNVHKHRRID